MTGQTQTTSRGWRRALAVTHRGWDQSIGAVLIWLLVTPIRGYQRFVSPLTPPSCRLHPSCSAYAAQAISTHGALKGMILAGWRIGRCNPWNRGGLDPVPPRGRWLPDVLPDGSVRHGTMSPRGRAGTPG